MPFIGLSHPYIPELIESSLMLRIVAVLFLLAFAVEANATEVGWALLRDGEHVVLISNAMTPGAADPTDFDIGKCSTQRNLSERGKQQARKMGALLAARAAPFERILSSRYCRALETAALAFEDEKVEPFEPLDLLPKDAAAAGVQTKAVMDEIRAWSGSGNFALVTHKENIKALTGLDVRDGEAIIVRLDGESLHVLGRIAFN